MDWSAGVPARSTLRIQQVQTVQTQTNSNEWLRARTLALQCVLTFSVTPHFAFLSRLASIS